MIGEIGIDLDIESILHCLPHLGLGRKRDIRPSVSVGAIALTAIVTIENAVALLIENLERGRPIFRQQKATTTLNKGKTSSKEGAGAASPSKLIAVSIKELGDWRGKTLARIRALIKQADPEVVEEWKWGLPVWSHAGIICTGETYKNAVKTTFAKGASLKDPSGLFNSSLEGATRRAIDFRQGDEINEDAFKKLIRAAAALNKSSAR